MKNLSTIQDYVNTGYDTLLKKGLHKFVVGLAEELINVNDIEPVEEYHFMENYRHTVRRTQQLDLSIDSSLEIKTKNTCDFIDSNYDETDIGGAAIGQITGVKNIEVEIEKITMYLFDGSEFDLSDDLHDLVFKYLS